MPGNENGSLFQTDDILAVSVRRFSILILVVSCGKSATPQSMRTFVKRRGFFAYEKSETISCCSRGSSIRTLCSNFS